ncbi:MAG: cadherin-like beta sandwich domain-containing protein [Nitrospira sp.]
MRQAFPLAGRCIGAVLFSAIGLATYGCGDTGTVNPVVELASVTVSPGTLQPGFSGGTTQYRVDVTTDVTSVTVTAQAAVAGDAVTIDGQRTTSRSVTLDPPGSTTVINIVVSETDTNSRTYVIRVVRAGLAGNNSLESLTVSPGTLAPTFDENLQSYTASVDNNVGSVTVTSTLSDTAATMTVNGQATNSGQARTITLNAGGQSTTITIIVTAQNGNSKTYVVTVSRGRSNNNNLQSLGISPGTLSPSFRAGTTGYTVNLAATLANNPANVTVTPRLQDTAATMTVNGQTTTSGQARTTPLPAQGSNTFINIVVVAQDGTPKTYTVNVIRAALGGNNNLSGLTVSPGPLAPVFSAATTSYTVDVASTVASITVTPTRQDSNATITVNGQAATSGQAQTVTLRAAGLSTSIPIMVTAPNGSSKTYTITVDRAALGGNNNLSGLTVSPGPLAPVFSAATTSYTVDVASNVASITVTPTRQDSNATITVNGQATNSGQARTVTLRAAGLNTLINTVVTAPNNSSKTYTITVERAALGGNNNLQNLTVSPGSLAPAFTAARIAYTVNVGSSDTSITVNATPQDSSATVTINGQGPNSRSIPLPGGPANTEIEVRVIAPNGTDKTYLITVNQPAPAAPPAPTSAPDLIPQSDSCPLLEPPDPLNPNQCAPGTSREDNITNVNTPSFTIPQPGAGETPHLYVDGTKVKDGFDQGATTLTPPSSLSDGVHSITSTVSNGGSESGQSPALSVTIDTGAPGTPLP